jgi:hypothetical protein
LPFRRIDDRLLTIHSAGKQDDRQRQRNSHHSYHGSRLKTTCRIQCARPVKVQTRFDVLVATRVDRQLCKIRDADWRFALLCVCSNTTVIEYRMTKLDRYWTFIQ